MLTCDLLEPRRYTPESESGTESLISLPSDPFLCVPSKRMIGTFGFTYGVSLMRHSRRSTKSAYSFWVQSALSPVASLMAS